jgi:HK97 gp10 family phage protein
MAEFKVTIEGLDQLELKLRDETKKLATRVLRRAGREGASVWVKAIEERAPELTGFLKTHIEMASKTTGGDEGKLTVFVGPDKPAYYGSFQEFGTRYQPANPFMRPAFEQTKDQVLDVFVTDLKEELDSLKE